MGSETSVGGMIVSYAADLSKWTSGISTMKSDMSGMSGFIQSSTGGIASALENVGSSFVALAQKSSETTSVFKGMNGAADGAKIISNEDVAQAKLTLLESKVKEARAALAEMQNSADAGKAVTGMPEAEAQLTLLEADAQRARQGLQELQSQEEQTGATSSGGFLSGIKSAVTGITDFMGGLGKLQWGYQAITGAAQGFYDKLLAGNAKMEETQVAFETLLGKGKQTQDFLQSLKDFAAATPFEFPELATDAQHMLAFGFAAKDVIPTLTNIGDAMGAMGKSNADIDHIVEVFGQMHAAGKLNAGDMMQIADEGIPAWKMLAEAMGKTVPEVQKLSSQGLIPADTAIKAVSQGMHNMFGGGMAAQANTFLGLLSTVQDNANAALRAFSGPLFSAAKDGLTQLGNLVSSKSFLDFATMMGQGVGGGLSAIVTAGKPVVQLFQALASGWQQFFYLLDVGDLVASFQGLGSAVTNLYQKDFGPFSGMITQLSQTLQDVLAGALRIVVPLIDRSGIVIQGLTPILGGVFTGISGLANIVSQLAEPIASAVAAFLDWGNKSGALQGGLNLVSAAVSGIDGIILDANLALSGFLDWFNKGGPWVDVFKASVVGVTTALGVLKAIQLGQMLIGFIAMIPEMVVGWGAWAAGAWAAAIATIAATWPILAIGALIAIVVAVIILAVTHWGDITKWLSGVWSSFTSWFMGLLDGLGKWWAGVWKGIQSTGENVWNAIVSFVTMAGQHLLDAITGPFTAIGQLFIWLYGHNTYFKQLVDAIVGFFVWFGQQAMSIWTGFIGWITGLWTQFSAWTSMYWNAFVFIIQSYVNKAVSWLTGIWNNVVTWFDGVWKVITDKVGQAWAAISAIFQGAWDAYIAKPMNDIWTKFSNWFTQMKDNFMNFGSDLMHAIANGITGAVGAVGSAIHTGLSNILSGLGFHNIPGFAGGVKDFGGGWAVVGENGPELAYLPQGTDVYSHGTGPGGDTSGGSYPIKPSATTAAVASLQGSVASNSSANSTPQIIVLELDGMEMARVVGNYTDKLVRLKLGPRSIRAS